MEKVYFTNEITSDSLIKIYNALNAELKGNVGVKISTGEPGGKNYLNPVLIKGLVNKLNGTIIECCTAYNGRRMDPKDHWKVIEEHGFLDIAPCDIMDELGEVSIPVSNGINLKENIIGKNFEKYDSVLILSHFKGHAMGGFGGALKNMSIGIASSSGKAYIHTAGKTKDVKKMWLNLPKQDKFLESMADACKSIIDMKGKENIIYINVLNNLSVDCDCDANPKQPEMKDIGIMASLDPVALDQASVDMIYNSLDEGKKDLIKRIESKNGIHTIDSAEKLGLGSKMYELINID